MQHVISSAMKWIAYDEISGPQFAEIVGSKDVILIPTSAPENHGPHLPLGTDIFISQRIAEEVADKYAKKYPERNAFVYPALTIGGATIRGRGSVKVRSKDLRRSMKFLGLRLIKQGFRRIVFVSGHGGVPHVIALDKAGAYLTGLIRRTGDNGAAFAPTSCVAGRVFAGVFIEKWKQDKVSLPENIEDILLNDLHGGWLETSLMLAVRPDLVHENYKQILPILPPERGWLNSIENILNRLLARDRFSEELKKELEFSIRIGKNDLSWIIRGRQEGYSGYPALSTAEFGNVLLDTIADDMTHALDEVFEQGISPAKYRSVGYLFGALKYLGIAFLALLVLLLFIFFQ